MFLIAYENGFLHTTPFDAKGSNTLVFLFLGLVDLLTTNEIAFLHSGTQTSSTNDIQKVKFLFPVHATAQEVTVEAKRVARIRGVLTSEPQTG